MPTVAAAANEGEQPALARRGQPHSIWRNARRRLRHEYRLMCAQAPPLLLCGFIMIYGSTMVFRNLAFYRYEARPRLKDLGYDILPDLENIEIWAAMVDFPMQTSMWAMAATCVCSLFWGNRHTPYAVNMLRRVLTMLAIGHCMRFGTYISTTIPGTAEHCLPGHLDEMHPPQPKTMREVFLTRIALNPGNNCGDLMFSGHIMGIVTPVLMVQRYAVECFVDTKLMQAFTLKVLIIFLWTLTICQAVLIIMMRNHYTSDVVVSMYLTPLLWSYYCRVLHPVDLHLPHHSHSHQPRAAAAAESLSQPLVVSEGREQEEANEPV